MRISPGVLAPPDERRAPGGDRRERLAPSEHAQWEPPRRRPEPSRTEIAHSAIMRFLNAWYSCMGADEVTRLYDTAQPKKAVRRRRKDVREALQRISLKALMKFCDQAGGEYRIRPDHLVRRVVGVGSVGTEAFVLLLGDRADEPPFLQLKEQKELVLAAYADPREYRHQGVPVSKGQRMTQAATDQFLGRAKGIAADANKGQDPYVRQLLDMKGGVDVLAMDHGQQLVDHGRPDFALAHADQNAKGYQRLMDAVTNGRVRAVTELSGTNPQPRLTGPLLPRAQARHRRARGRPGLRCVPPRRLPDVAGQRGVYPAGAVLSRPPSQR